MNQTTPQMKTTTANEALYLAVELSEKSWCLLFTDGGERHRHSTVAVGDLDALMREVAKAKTRLELPHTAPVVSCYEAGRDGFWIHRALEARGVSNVIIDPGSIEVSQRMRRVKTDRVDLQKLMRALVRYLGGDKRVLSAVTVPSEDAEDARRSGRELGRLKQEQTAHLCRIRSLLVLHGVREKKLPKKLRDVRIWNGQPLPPVLRSELEREYERLELIRAQIVAIHQQREHRLEATAKRPSEFLRKVMTLASLKGIGETSSWHLVEEAFGWRTFRNRRQVGGFAGLGAAPHSSGNIEYDQGITKGGNKRVRTLVVQLAWCWLRFQPESALAKWYRANFERNARLKRVGICGLARRLLIALWRFVEQGVVPEGAVFSN